MRKNTQVGGYTAPATGEPMKRLGWVVAALLVLGLPGYYALVRHSPSAGEAFALDLAELRELADELPGARPSEIRYEHVMTLTFAEAMIMAGAPWRKSPMPVYAFQLVYPDRTLMVDAALDRATAQPDFMVAMFDDGAYQRMNRALLEAAQIVITHEHMDHIGGIAAHPQLAALLPALRLTPEQLGNPKGMEPAQLPADAMQGYTPLRYERLHALAPGVVLIKAPGHTPGSQMVYVQRADGRELLLLGDVSWRLRNIEQQRERPLFMTLLIGEDRGQVMGQFQALQRLQQLDPLLRLVPGHDGPAMDALTEAGLLTRGFAAPQDR
jgi:glyoxylase-like metal-dependent hydrolase (beta-lactamase superfamily II)